MDKKWLTVEEGSLTFDSEGDDNEGSDYFTRLAHVPNNNGKVIDNSGITIGRQFSSWSLIQLSHIFECRRRGSGVICKSETKGTG